MGRGILWLHKMNISCSFLHLYNIRKQKNFPTNITRENHECFFFVRGHFYWDFHGMIYRFALEIYRITEEKTRETFQNLSPPLLLQMQRKSSPVLEFHFSREDRNTGTASLPADTTIGSSSFCFPRIFIMAIFPSIM